MASLYRNAAGGRQNSTNLLLAFDGDLADAARAGRCRHCDGALHSAKFKRKPRGRGCAKLSAPASTTSASASAAPSTAAGAETPASLRFLGRRVYVAAIVVLIAILKHGATDARLARLSGSSPASTAARSRTAGATGGATRCTATPFWRIARARFHATGRSRSDFRWR